MRAPDLLRRLRAALFPRARFAASPVTDANVTQGLNWNTVYRDRYSYDRDKVLAEALNTWRLNPLARRLVEIQTQYVTDGIDFACDDPAALTFLRDFWDHPLNRIGEHLAQWADELALTGNLFVSITTPGISSASRAGAMSYLRIYPTDLMAEIETAANDIQQEKAFLPRATAGDPQPRPIPGYWAQIGGRTGKLEGRPASPGARTVMLHYAVNRLAGTLWGEPDLAPLLPWLGRYAGWLEDRMRLNRFRQAYLFIVRGKYENRQEREARQRELLYSPPQPGTVLVTDQDEDWDVLSPKLDSFEANNDGLALKKFIAGGRGYPLHWLAEPESSTRTTAEAAGTPTFKGLESRQKMFLSLVRDVLTVAARRAGFDASPRVHAADISERDNAALALASTQVVHSFGELWANGFIDEQEYLRIVYRFAGEVLPAARPDSPQPRRGSSPRSAAGMHVDAASGDVRIKEPHP